MKKPYGWKWRAKWWTKDSVYGVRYMCPECGKKVLGTSWRDDSHHHRSNCPRLKHYEDEI